MTWDERWNAVRSAVDARDLHFYAGLLIAGAGGALLNVAWALVGVGCVLVLVGLGFTLTRR